tara:strand:- start:27011 stop:27199 length:189 start_codon:yes stop_codon:yes gene_type:complete
MSTESRSIREILMAIEEMSEKYNLAFNISTIQNKQVHVKFDIKTTQPAFNDDDIIDSLRDGI